MNGEGRIPAEVLDVLREYFSELEPVDRDLDLGQGRRVDWVAVDPLGRLVLALWAEPGSEDDAVVLTALDALAFWSEHRPVLGAHFRTPRLRPDLEPLVVIVASRFSKRGLGRLAGVRPECLRLFELRFVASERGERVYLIPVAPGAGSAAAGEPPALKPWTEGLEGELADLAQLAQRRIERVDDELIAVRSDHGVRWQLADDYLCSLFAHSGRLEGRLRLDGEARDVSTEEDADRFLDDVLARYVGLLDARISSNGAASVRSEDAAGSDADGELEDELDGDSPLRKALDQGVLLTPEELEAFR